MACGFGSTGPGDAAAGWGCVPPFTGAGGKSGVLAGLGGVSGPVWAGVAGNCRGPVACGICFGAGSPAVGGAVGGDGAAPSRNRVTSRRALNCCGASAGAPGCGSTGAGPRGGAMGMSGTVPAGAGTCAGCVPIVGGAVGGRGGATPRSRASTCGVRLAGTPSRFWKENRPDEGALEILYRARRASLAASGAGGASVLGAGGGAGVGAAASVAGSLTGSAAAGAGCGTVPG